MLLWALEALRNLSVDFQHHLRNGFAAIHGQTAASADCDRSLAFRQHYVTSGPPIGLVISLHDFEAPFTISSCLLYVPLATFYESFTNTFRCVGK